MGDGIVGIELAGTFSLIDAAREDSTKVQEMLEHGADPNSEDQVLHRGPGVALGGGRSC